MRGEKSLMRRLTDGSGISRRDLLKGVTAVTAASALAGCSSGSDEIVYVSQDGDSGIALEEERVAPAVCRPNCGNACYLNAHIRNGRIVKLSPRDLPDKRYNRICLRGLSSMQRVYSPTRLKYPIMRKPGSPRGKPEWVKITWTEAIKHIGDKLKSLHDRFPKTSVAQMPASGNYAILQKGLFSRVQNGIAQTIIHPRIDMTLSLGLSKVIGKAVNYPYMQNNEPADLMNAKTIIAWGSNVAEAQVHNWHFIADAMEHNDAMLIAVDVMLSSTASRADRFVNIQPGTDTILAMAMLNEIMKRDNRSAGYPSAGCWVNYEFMEKNTVAPFLVHEDVLNPNNWKFVRYSHLSSAAKTMVSNAGHPGGIIANDAFIAYDESNATFVATMPGSGELAQKHVFDSSVGRLSFTGVSSIDTANVKTAYQMLKERAAQYDTSTAIYARTKVDAAVVEDMAERYATQGPATIITGFAADHYVNGHHFYHAIASMAAVTGNIGRKGAGIGIFIVYGNISANTGDLLVNFAGGETLKVLPYPKLFQVADSASVDAEGNGGSNELFMGGSLPLRGLFVNFANPVNTFTNPDRLVKLLTAKDGASKDADGYKIELIVISDWEITDTAEYADVVLPLSYWFEQDDVIPNGTHPFITYQPKAVEPYAESKSDGECAALLAEYLRTAYPGVHNYNAFTMPSYETAEEWTVTPASLGKSYSAATGKVAPESEFNLYKLKLDGAIRSLPGTINEPYVYPALRKKAVLPSVVDDMVFGTTTTGSSLSGRMEFYNDVFWPDSLYGQTSAGALFDPAVDFTTQEWDLERLPGYEDPAELPGGTYPMQLISERPRWRVHSEFHNLPWLREFDPYPVVKISTDDAVGNIKDNDLVEISNGRGSCIAYARITPGLRKGVVNLPKGWHAKQFREFFPDSDGTSQSLTTEQVHKVTVNQSFFDNVVKIRKI